MNLKLALPGGRTIKVKAHFPYEGSPVGYRVLFSGKTAVVVGLANEGQEASLEFPDTRPFTTEKHIRALIDTANYYGLIPWYLLYKLLPSVFDWRLEEYISLSEKPITFLDKKSLEILSWVKARGKVREENLKKRFGNEPVKYLLELGFLTKKREWKSPKLVEKFYRLCVPLEEALQRLKRLKNKEEVSKLVYFLLEKRYASLEELKEQGFSSAQIKALLKKGIISEAEEVIPYTNPNFAKLRQEKKPLFRPLGSKSVLMGSWQEIKERLFEEFTAYIDRGESIFVFCDQSELLRNLYEEMYAVFGDRLVLLSSFQREKDFVKNWFRVYEEKGLVVLGSRIALLSPIKDLRLVVILGDRASRLQDGTDLRHFLFELSRYYGANFCVASPLPPLSLCLREGWQREVFIPSAEVVVIKRKPEEVLTDTTLKLLKENAKEENLILVNKVGYAYAYCKACGYIVECPRCGSFLTLSKDKSTVFCTSCGYKGLASCPECGRELQELGFGIDKAVEEVEKLIGLRENITFQTKPELGRTYDNVLVLHADNILSVPWYDSAEEYFSYMWKALSISKKRLIVQTVLEHNPLLEFLKTKDWEGFCKEELERRKEENLPPYTRLIRLEVRKEPDLSGLPVEVSKRRVGDLKELLVKVDTKNFASVLKFLRSIRPMRLEVL